MVRVIIHAGLPKTGTSSSQAAFAARRDILAEHGVHYPRLDPGTIPGHWALGVFWHDRMEPRYHLRRRLSRQGDVAAMEAAVRRALVQAIRAAQTWRGPGEGVVLLSDEHLSHPSALVGCRKLVRLIQRQGAHVEVLAHVRPDPALFPSRTQQQLKTYGRAYDVADMSHLPRVAALRAGFDSVPLHLRLFDAGMMEGADAVRDLCAWIERRIDRSLPDFGAVERVNEAIPAPGCALLQKLSRQGNPDDSAAERHYAHVRWATMTAQADLPAPRLVLPQDWLPRIEAQAQARWNALLPAFEHPPATLERFRMAAPPGLPAVTASEIEDWVAAGRDEAYERALRDWIAARPERWVSGCLEWLAQELARR